MRTSVLLSIKPLFASRIFEGSKLYEFRRSIFKDKNITTVIVYVSSPVRKVIGEFKIKGILKQEKECLWETTKTHSGISKEYFDYYFQDRTFGYAIIIGTIQLYSKPLELGRDFNINYAPQSFVYIKS